MTTEQTASMTAAIQRASRAIAAGNKARRRAMELEQAHSAALDDARELQLRLVEATAPAYVAETAIMMLAAEWPDQVVALDRVAADREDQARTDTGAYLTDMGDDVLTRPVSPFTDTRDLGHPAEPHSRQPGVCRTCRRPIHIRTDDQGGFVSAAHHA